MIPPKATDTLVALPPPMSQIWSIRFSGDSREIVAGAHFGDIYV